MHSDRDQNTLYYLHIQGDLDNLSLLRNLKGWMYVCSKLMDPIMN